MEATLTVTDNTVAGEKIRRYRTAAGLSQEQLASRIGVTKGMIGNYEKGIYKPRPFNTELLDAELHAGGEILAAYGVTPPVDWADQMDALRDQVGVLVGQVRRLQAVVDGLLDD